MSAPMPHPVDIDDSGVEGGDTVIAPTFQEFLASQNEPLMKDGMYIDDGAETDQDDDETLTDVSDHGKRLNNETDQPQSMKEESPAQFENEKEASASNNEKVSETPETENKVEKSQDSTEGAAVAEKQAFQPDGDYKEDSRTEVTESPEAKRQKIDQSKSGSPVLSQLCFPEAVHRMVCEADETDPKVIHWVQEGEAFMMDKILVKPLLMKYFRHSNYSSLQRQLNMYGWSKHVTGKYKGAFFHPLFKQGTPTEDLRTKFVRRVQSRRPCPVTTTTATEKPLPKPATKRRRKPMNDEEDEELDDRKLMEKQNGYYLRTHDNFRQSLTERWEKTLAETSSKWKEFVAKSTEEKKNEWTAFHKQHALAWESLLSREDQEYRESVADCEEYYSRLSFFAGRRYLEGFELYAGMRNRRMVILHRIIYEGVEQFISQDMKIQIANWKHFLDNQRGNFEEFMDEEKALLTKHRRACSRLLAE